MKVYIGIDPGASGGITAILNTNIPKILSCSAFKELGNARFVLELLKSQKIELHALIENVHAFPTDGRSSAFKFGKNAGQWEGLLTAFAIPFDKVVPHKWMSWYGEMPKNKQERKNKLKELAQKVLDDCGEKQKATLKTADAILIANYNLKGGLNDKPNERK